MTYLITKDEHTVRVSIDDFASACAVFHTLAKAGFSIVEG